MDGMLISKHTVCQIKHNLMYGCNGQIDLAHIIINNLFAGRFCLIYRSIQAQLMKAYGAKCPAIKLLLILLQICIYVFTSHEAVVEDAGRKKAKTHPKLG